MARKKPLNIYPVKTLEDANEALEQISAFQRTVDTEELAMNEKIDAIKAKTEMSVAAHQKKIQAMENGLQAFCEFNKDNLFEKKRSIELNFGTIGFRKTTKLAPKPKITWKRVLELLEEKGFKSGIRVKKSANKEVLNEWSDEKLDKVNVIRKKSDEFWYDPKEEELQKVEG